MSGTDSLITVKIVNYLIMETIEILHGFVDLRKLQKSEDPFKINELGFRGPEQKEDIEP